MALEPVSTQPTRSGKEGVGMARQIPPSLMERAAVTERRSPAEVLGRSSTPQTSRYPTEAPTRSILTREK